MPGSNISPFSGVFHRRPDNPSPYTLLAILYSHSVTTTFYHFSPLFHTLGLSYLRPYCVWCPCGSTLGYFILLSIGNPNRWRIFFLSAWAPQQFIHSWMSNSASISIRCWQSSLIYWWRPCLIIRALICSFILTMSYSECPKIFVWLLWQNQVKCIALGVFHLER